MQFIRFLKKKYKLIGVIVLAVLLVVSFIVNIRLMKSDEAKGVAAYGGYEQYDEAMNSLDAEPHDFIAAMETEADEDSEPRSVNSGKNADGAVSISREDAEVGNRLQDMGFFTDDEEDEAAQKEGNCTSIGGSGNNTKVVGKTPSTVATTGKTPNAVTQGAVNQSSGGTVVIGSGTSTATKPRADTKYKPEESKADGEREKLKEFIGEAWNHTGDRYLYILYQKPDYSKKIKVTVQVDYLSIFEDGVECNDERFKDRLKTDGYIIHPCEVECYQGENCWDAIARALIYYDVQYTCDAEPFKHGYDMDNKYGTCYLSCCDNMYAGVNAEGKSGPFGNSMSGWTYTVTNASGKTVYPGLGMNGVLIKDGDKLRLKYHNGLEPFSLDEYGKF